MARQRIVLCMGRHCNQGGQATPFYERLKAQFGYPGLLGGDPSKPKFETATCLDHCEEGPNLVIYPAGHWFHHLDIPTLETALHTLTDDNT